MATPILVALEPSHPGAAALAAAGHAAALEDPRWFLVVREGAFNGRSYGVGEVLLCGGGARHGHEVVLVARGQGRPRLGTVRGSDLHGDVGERCHPARWFAAGRLVASARPSRSGWRTCALEREVCEPQLVSRRAAAREVAVPCAPRAAAPRAVQRRPSRAQLSLFAEAA